MKKQPRTPSIVFYVLIFVIILTAVSVLSRPELEPQLQYSEVIELFAQEKVKTFTTKDDIIRMELHEPLDGEVTVAAELPSFSFRISCSGQCRIPAGPHTLRKSWWCLCPWM